jgi:Tfp pilus assembly protein PilN
MPRRINLVPKGERARTTTNVGMLAVVAVGILVLFALGLGYYWFSNSLSDRKQELEDIQAERSSLEAQVLALQTYDRLASERKSMEETIQGIYAGRTLVADVLDDISQVVPTNAWFAELRLTTADPDAWDPAQLEGPSDNTFSIEGETYTMNDVAQVLVRLQLVPALYAVTLVSATAEAETDTMTFSIEGIVVNNQPEDTSLPMSALVDILGVDGL